MFWGPDLAQSLKENKDMNCVQKRVADFRQPTNVSQIWSTFGAKFSIKIVNISFIVIIYFIFNIWLLYVFLSHNITFSQFHCSQIATVFIRRNLLENIRGEHSICSYSNHFKNPFTHAWCHQLFDAKLHSSSLHRLVGCEMINSLFVFPVAFSSVGFSLISYLTLITALLFCGLQPYRHPHLGQIFGCFKTTLRLSPT